MDFQNVISDLESQVPSVCFKSQKGNRKADRTWRKCDSYFSFNAQTCDTRFGSAKDYVEGICDITGNEGIRTICAAEPIGPNNFLDIMVIAPCTGNTAAKLCNGITDTPVLMAAKAHMRNGKPLVISISTNDALGANFKNIGMLMNTKNVYFVPFGQDNCKSKPNSLVAKMELLPETIEYALNGRQIQPVIQNPD